MTHTRLLLALALVAAAVLVACGNKREPPLDQPEPLPDRLRWGTRETKR